MHPSLRHPEESRWNVYHALGKNLPTCFLLSSALLWLFREWYQYDQACQQDMPRGPFPGPSAAFTLWLCASVRLALQTPWLKPASAELKESFFAAIRLGLPALLLLLRPGLSSQLAISKQMQRAALMPFSGLRHPGLQQMALLGCQAIALQVSGNELAEPVTFSSI